MASSRVIIEQLKVLEVRRYGPVDPLMFVPQPVREVMPVACSDHPNCLGNVGLNNTYSATPNEPRISRGRRVARGVPREQSERPLADHVTPKHVG
jgi:hypothetical protein